MALAFYTDERANGQEQDVERPWTPSGERDRIHGQPDQEVAVAATEEAVRRDQEEHEARERTERAARAEGQSLEDQAQNGGTDDESKDEGPQLVLPGVPTSKLTLNAGGKRPTSSMFKLRSLSLPISENAELPKEGRVWIAVECEIDGVHFDNQRKGREVVAVVRTHKATPLAVQVLPDPGESS